MSLRVAINGFGRIGRNILRALIESGISDLEIVAINDLAPANTLIHLLKYDSVHGTLKQAVEVNDEGFVLNGKSVKVCSSRDIKDLPWKELAVDIVFECTGFFTNREDAYAHIDAGAKKVLISAPGNNADKTIVFGVNHDVIGADDIIISNGSCTTNALAPVAKVLDENFGIENGFMTTVHSYTGDQPTLDTVHKNLNRGRAAALSMVPTSTGAAKAIGLVLPQLAGKLDGKAIRVPTPNVSVVDLCVNVRKNASIESVNTALTEAAKNTLNGILQISNVPLVSIDFNHDPHSSTAAMDETVVVDGSLIRVLSWYDNEWGFSNRMIDTALVMGRFIDKAA